MIHPHVFWRDAAARLCLQAHNPHLTTDEMQLRLEFIEFTTWPTNTRWQRQCGWVTTPPQVVCGHLVVWQFDFDDRHCTVWPLEVLSRALFERLKASRDIAGDNRRQHRWLQHAAPMPYVGACRRCAGGRESDMNVLP